MTVPSSDEKRNDEKVMVSRDDLEVIEAVLERRAKHTDCEDCWYSCATLTCDDARWSEECDCGADVAATALASVRSVLSPAAKQRDEKQQEEGGSR